MKADKLWIRWLDTFYFKGQELLQWQIKSTSSWILRKIVKNRDTICHTEYWQEAANKGRYQTRNMYKSICGDLPKARWRKILFDNHARPRAQFLFWLALQKRLPTKERLRRIGIHLDPKCCLCDTSEDLQHLFFACNFSNKVWLEILSWLKVQHTPLEWDKEVDWIIQKINKNSGCTKILKIAFTEVVYEIWKHRNSLSFNSNIIEGGIVNRIKD